MWIGCAVQPGNVIESVEVVVTGVDVLDLFSAYVCDSDSVWEFEFVVPAEDRSSPTEISFFERNNRELRICNEYIHCADAFLVPECIMNVFGGFLKEDVRDVEFWELLVAGCFYDVFSCRMEFVISVAPSVEKVRVDDCRHSSLLVPAGFNEFDSVGFGALDRIKVFGSATFFGVFRVDFPPKRLLIYFPAVYVTLLE